LARARVVLALSLALLTSPGVSQSKPTAEERTARYFASVRKQPNLLLPFLREMPKGGDLHNHLGGSVYAESLIDYAAADELCVDRTSSILLAPPCDTSCDRLTGKPAVRCAYGDQVLYNSMVDAWSMRNWNPGQESGHDHFFATFDKSTLARGAHRADEIAEAATRAAEDHLQFLELMHTADGLEAAELGSKIGWNDHLPEFRERLLAGGLRDIARSTRKRLDEDESKVRSELKCGTAQPGPGCAVTVRYLYQVLRGLTPEAVFAQAVLGFELASSDPRFLGLNLVQPEDWYIPMRDFELHMQMFDYLHGVYPKVHISLHAGELALGLVPPEGLRFHIRDSIERGHAERIGQGVDIMNERDPIALLRRMARQGVLVEVCLTSNDLILSVRGDDHPLPIYVRYGVPVSLGTDDEGVLRSDLTHEFLRAAETYNFLSYRDLKRMVRLSLEHSFLPGASLWSDTRAFRRGNLCADTGDEPQSAPCQKLLAQSERARLQWKLEGELADFEKKY
jgi:adenosine deaminase